ncbi:MAG: AAA family ATPase, partial [Candidatus Aureabacteria bacterium]|nr:AAA family ATPase [Candidatus Auribacterota bacterium]
MLVQFTVKNFRSFKDEVTLSLVASSIKERVDENTLAISENLSLLKSAVIYGANASGKSNLFHAMRFMKQFIQNSSKETQAKEKINITRFKLSTETEDAPASFEIIFIYEGIRYRYGFAVDEERVHAEWLFYVPGKQEVEIFTRMKQDFNLTKHFKSEEDLVKGERVRVRSNALLLSVSAQLNGKIARKIVEWLSRFNCISGLRSDSHANAAFSLMDEEEGRNAILEFLKDADTGIEDVKKVENKASIDEFPPYMHKFFTDKSKENNFFRINIKTYHPKYNKKKEIVDSIPFDMMDDESAGTQRLFELSGAIINTLKEGKVLVVDELAARLHP